MGNPDDHDGATAQALGGTGGRRLFESIAARLAGYSKITFTTETNNTQQSQ